jgi:hypothetical protein
MTSHVSIVYQILATDEYGALVERQLGEKICPSATLYATNSIHPILAFNSDPHNENNFHVL